MFTNRIILTQCFVLVYLLVSGISTIEAAVERRAALDIGSGKTKLTVGDVDTLSNQVVRVIHSEFARIRFADSLMNNPYNIFDDELYAMAVEKISMLRDRAEQEGAVRITAVATEAFRKASNSIDFLERLKGATGVPMQIISQEDEATLGFETAVQATGYPCETLISWDSGSGSLQLTNKTDKEVIDYLIPYGTTPATHLLLELKVLSPSKGDTPNPVTFEEATAFVEQMQNLLPEPSNAFQDRLNDINTKFVGIGNRSSTIGVCARATGKNLFSAQELWDGILSLIDKKDEDLIDLYKDTSTRTVLPRLLLTFSVMSKLGIEHLEWTDTNGNGLGILGNYRYWKNTGEFSRRDMVQTNTRSNRPYLNL